MKIRKFYGIKLNEGLRVNTEILNLYGKFRISDVIDSLDNIIESTEPISIGIFEIDSDKIKEEASAKVKDLKVWRKDRWRSIQGFGTEWIPLSE